MARIKWIEFISDILYICIYLNVIYKLILITKTHGHILL